MDSIDITDVDFSLENYDTNYGLSSNINNDGNDYKIFMYIGIIIFIGLIGIFIFKYYQNKKQSEVDCTGGFCTLNNQHNVNI